MRSECTAAFRSLVTAGTNDSLLVRSHFVTRDLVEIAAIVLFISATIPLCNINTPLYNTIHHSELLCDASALCKTSNFPTIQVHTLSCDTHIQCQCHRHHPSMAIFRHQYDPRCLIHLTQVFLNEQASSSSTDQI